MPRPATSHPFHLLWGSRLPRVRVGARAEAITDSLSLVSSRNSKTFPQLSQYKCICQNSGSPVDSRQSFVPLRHCTNRPVCIITLSFSMYLWKCTFWMLVWMTAMSPPVAAEGAQPVATVTPSVLNAQQGQRAEFRCTVTGNPTPAIEWIGTTTSVVSGSCLIQLKTYSFGRNLPSACAKLHPASLNDSIQLWLAGGPGNRMSPRAVIRGGVLTFTATEPTDEGEYTCKALNTHGEHTARVSLFVQSMLCVNVCEKCFKSPRRMVCVF